MQFSGASGHSQGLISVFFFFFSSKGDVSFFENMLKAPNQFFFAGLQGQQLFLVFALELSVNGLLLKDRQPYISKVNKYIRSVHPMAPTDFSKRESVFSARFPVMGVPFLSQYLQDATDKVIDKDLNGEELWTAEGLAVGLCAVWWDRIPLHISARND